MTPGLSDPDCIDRTVDVLDKISLSPLQIPFTKPVYSQVTNTCWKVQSGGMYVNNGGQYLQLNGVGAMMQLDDVHSAYSLAGDRVIISGGSRVFAPMSVLDRPMEKLTIPQGMNVPLSIDFAGNKSVWTLRNPGTNDAMSVRTRHISPNGMWLVVESAWGLVRVNLETREMIPFESASGYYSNEYNFTISDNGRYVIVMQNFNAVRLYDLATCSMNGVSGQKIAAGCGKRDLTKDLMPTSATTSVVAIRFNGLGDGLTYLAQENKVWKRYSVLAPGQAEHGIDYLALGDSYVSGEGDGDGARYYVPGTDGDGMRVPLYNTGITNYPYAKEKCHLSSRSYPYLLAGDAQLQRDGFRSVACSGADANDVGNVISTGERKDFLNGHFDQLEKLSNPELGEVKKYAIDNFIPGRAAQIEFVARYKPKVLTIGLGGNDLGFADKLSECVTNQQETCRYATFDIIETVRELRDHVYTRFGDLLRKIKSASPTTRIYVVGYPQIIGTSACNANVLLDDREQAYVRATLSYLNDTLEAAASAAGVNYLDIEHALDGENLCSGRGYPAINGLTKGNDIFGVIGAESYHPNEDGHALIASAIKNTLHGTSLLDYSPCGDAKILHCNTYPSKFPAIPDFFFTSPSSWSAPRTVPQPLITDEQVDDIVTPGQFLIVQPHNPQEQLRLDSRVYVRLKSTPVELSPTTPLMTDNKGLVRAQVQIPADTSLGIHTLHLIATTLSGEPIDYYQPILVVASLNDYDGDGILNQDDACQFVTPSGVDADYDGIDDACEGDLRPHTPPPTVTEPSPPRAPAEPAILGDSITLPTPYQGPIASVVSTGSSEAIRVLADDHLAEIPSSSAGSTNDTNNINTVATTTADQTSSHRDSHDNPLRHAEYTVAGAAVVTIFFILTRRLLRK